MYDRLLNYICQLDYRFGFYVLSDQNTFKDLSIHMHRQIKTKLIVHDCFWAR